MPKVALCISGKIGNVAGKTNFNKSDTRILKKAYELYKLHIIDKNDVDIFVHCWDVEFEQEIRELFAPKGYIIEKQRKFKIPNYVKGSDRPWKRKEAMIRKQSHYSKWYSIKAVNELRKDYEIKNKFKYDFVMTTRFDIAFMKDLIFKDFDNQFFYAANWTAFVDKNGEDRFKGGKGDFYDLIKRKDPELQKLNKVNLGYPNDQNGLLDFWFFTNSEYANKFFDLYDHLDNYLKEGNCPPSNDKAKVISNHQLSLYHLQKLNLITKLKFAFELYDDFPLIRRKYFEERMIQKNNKSKLSNIKKSIKSFLKFLSRNLFNK